MDQYKNYRIGENKLCYPQHEFILKTDAPRLEIKYKLKYTMFDDFDDFYLHVEEVNWLDGVEPDANEREEILINAYNFLALDEQLLQWDIDDINDLDEF